MATSSSSNESIVGYITNISQENKKQKFYVKFSMQCQNNRQVDGWIFSGTSGILTTPLGLAITSSMDKHTGVRIWGKIEENNGSTVFKTQSWANFKQINPGFIFEGATNDLLSIRDALTCIEFCSIRVFIIDIRQPENFNRQGVIHTNTFILIGDETGTCFLAATDLAADTLLVEHTYNLNQIRRKLLNGMPILSTTINTNISLSTSEVTPDLTEVATTLGTDLSDNQSIISSIEEVGSINRLNKCSSCKTVLTDVDGAATLLYCQKCKRHSLKNKNNFNVSTTLAIRKGQEKIVLWTSGTVLEELLNIVNLTPTANDTDIAIALLSNHELRFQYSELQRELLAISKP